MFSYQDINPISIEKFRGVNSRGTIFQPGLKSCNKAIVNADGDLLFVSSGNEIYGYNLFTECCFRIYTGHDAIIEDFDVDSKSNNLVSVGMAGTVFIHEIETGNVLLTIPVGHLLRCCCISPLNSMVAVVTSTQMKQEPVLHVYHFTQNGKSNEKTTFTFERGINSIMYISDNQIVCGDVDGKLLLVDTGEGKKGPSIAKTVNAHRGPINVIRKSWDGRFFATASADTTACTWETESFEKLGTFPHSFLVSSVAISPIANHIVLASSADKKNVASTNFGSTDFTINFFNLIFQDEFASMKVFKSPVNDVVFTPDGMTLIATSQEGTFMIIRLGDEYYQQCKALKNEEEELEKETRQ
ncbi:hypothetical protein TRFO_07323 [Tritrichomonas foetus]|uniref:Serine-threonine kinase receptor-associated protein n=1 Tax=Tritrichomonas foetus TaxID=1144522 RepID=A0A1J4JX56_9EUKA|nr:hypothetical protein TRFO_07323 [Tritrichomonas foetus]|eukprot:OHT02118.1 hypothetical protein TRFO_07323 [Tritrichomonas foetus]